MMMHVSARAMARPVCVCACDTVARPASPCSFGACFSEDVRVDGVRGRDGVRAFSRRSVSGVFISVPTARRSRSGQPGGVLGLWPLLQERYLG